MAKKNESKEQERRRIAARNWLAIHAHNRKGGPMKNRKKAANKKACRGRVTNG